MSKEKPMQSDNHNVETDEISICELIFKNGNTCDLRESNVLEATPSQAVTWRFLIHSLGFADHFDELMVRAIHESADDRYFLAELLDYFSDV
jgi:hypothetical protein